MDLVYLIIGFIFIIFLAICLVIAYIVHEKQQIGAEIAYNKYKLERKKLYKASKGKKGQDDDGDDEVDEFLDSMPDWLVGILDGAQIDVEKLYYQDPQELAKLKGMIEKIQLPGQTPDVTGLLG